MDKPILFNPTKEKLEDFRGRIPVDVVLDTYEEQLKELFLIRNPKYRFDKNYQAELDEFLKSHFADKPKEEAGNWFYFPWKKLLIHYLPDEIHQELRTARNRFLITEEEQKKYYNAVIGVLGMSVGSHVALTIVMTGGAKHIKIADPDTISASNLNRIRTGFCDIDVGKVVSVARQIYEMNPYAEIKAYEKGLSEENINEFLVGDNKLDVLVEEMDNPYLKIKVRLLARELGIPIIMAADNGDGAIVDVERYDLDKNLPILHGIVSEDEASQFNNIKPEELPAKMAKIAGANIATLKMLKSVIEVGKTIYSWPQLGNAATICGSVLTYLARRIVLKENINSGRYLIDMDAIFEADFNSPQATEKREKERGEILKLMGL